MLLRCTQSLYATLTRENAVKYDREALCTALPMLNVTCNCIEYTTSCEKYTRNTVIKTIFPYFSFSYFIRRFVCCAPRFPFKKGEERIIIHKLKSSRRALCKFKQRYRSNHPS